MPTEAPRVLGVVGPTASGKSDLALDLAEMLGAHIVGADASQLYRGMDIGTAKVPPGQRRGIPHHQIDVLDVTAEASVAAYQRSARADLDGILASDRPAVLVGGSGLYVRAALDVLEIPPTDPATRAALTERAERESLTSLYAELSRLDPAAAAAIEPRNARRVIRSLEVIALTGRPFSATLPTREFVRPTVVIGLRPPREWLDHRIETRTRAMFDDGLVEETRGLLDLGLRDGRTASRAVGYAQALAVIDGVMRLEDAIADTAMRTRRLVRRQESWFGSDPRISWFDPTTAGWREALDTHLRDALSGTGPASGDNGAHG